MHNLFKSYFPLCLWAIIASQYSALYEESMMNRTNATHGTDGTNGTTKSIKPYNQLITCEKLSLENSTLVESTNTSKISTDLTVEVLLSVIEKHCNYSRIRNTSINGSTHSKTSPDTIIRLIVYNTTIQEWNNLSKNHSSTNRNSNSDHRSNSSSSNNGSHSNSTSSRNSNSTTSRNSNSTTSRNSNSTISRNSNSTTSRNSNSTTSRNSSSSSHSSSSNHSSSNNNDSSNNNYTQKRPNIITGPTEPSMLPTVSLADYISDSSEDDLNVWPPINRSFENNSKGASMPALSVERDTDMEQLNSEKIKTTKEDKGNGEFSIAALFLIVLGSLIAIAFLTSAFFFRVRHRVVGMDESAIHPLGEDSPVGQAYLRTTESASSSDFVSDFNSNSSLSSSIV